MIQQSHSSVFAREKVLGSVRIRVRGRIRTRHRQAEFQQVMVAGQRKWVGKNLSDDKKVAD